MRLSDSGFIVSSPIFKTLYFCFFCWGVSDRHGKFSHPHVSGIFLLEFNVFFGTQGIRQSSWEL